MISTLVKGTYLCVKRAKHLPDIYELCESEIPNTVVSVLSALLQLDDPLRHVRFSLFLRHRGPFRLEALLSSGAGYALKFGIIPLCLPDSC